MGNTINFSGADLGLINGPIKPGIKEYSVGTRSLTNPTERVDVGYNAQLGALVAVQRTTNSPTIHTPQSFLSDLAALCGCTPPPGSPLQPEGYRLSVGSTLKSYYDLDVEFNGVIPNVDLKTSSVSQSIFNVGFIDRFGNTVTTNLLDPHKEEMGSGCNSDDLRG